MITRSCADYDGFVDSEDSTIRDSIYVNNEMMLMFVKETDEITGHTGACKIYLEQITTVVER